jgi:hypothetical protein
MGHKKYLKKIERLMKEKGEVLRNMDGTPTQKNSVQIVHRRAFLRQYGK